MDNFCISIVSEGDIAPAMRLACGRWHKIVGYAIRDAVAGVPYSPDCLKDERDKYKLKSEKEAKERRLIFYWAKADRPDFVAFPFTLDADGAADFARRWLAEEDYGRQPDHDGDNGKGWRLYNESWGHVDSEYQAFVAISPRWAMYGK